MAERPSARYVSREPGQTALTILTTNEMQHAPSRRTADSVDPLTRTSLLKLWKQGLVRTWSSSFSTDVLWRTVTLPLPRSPATENLTPSFVHAIVPEQTEQLG